MTLPFFFKAAKAPYVEYIPITSEDTLEDTELKLTRSANGPDDIPPHEITFPSLFKAANASPLEYTATTPEDKLYAYGYIPPPYAPSPHAMTLPSVFKAAKALDVEYNEITDVTGV
jgi:hypothetical protein